MTYNGLPDLTKLKLEVPKLYDDKPDWDLFVHTMTSIIGVTNPQVLSIIPGFEDHPFVKQMQVSQQLLNQTAPPDSPIEGPLFSPKKENSLRKIKEEQSEDKNDSTELETVTGIKPKSELPSIVNFTIPTELKSEVPMLTTGSRRTVLYDTSHTSKYFEVLDKQKKDSWNRVLFAYLLQACSHDRKVMTIMRQGGTDGVKCYLALEKHYGGLELVKFQEDQQAIYYSYPKKVKEVSTWLAAYLNIIDKQEKRMNAPIPLLMKADMIINKLKHLPPFARYYENNWQALLPSQRPPWDEFLQVVQQIAQGSVSLTKMQKMYGTGSSRMDPITVNLVGRQGNRDRIRCYNCDGDHVMRLCLVRCTLKDCPRDGHDPNNCPIRKLKTVGGVGNNQHGIDEHSGDRGHKKDKEIGGRRSKTTRRKLMKKKGEKEKRRGNEERGEKGTGKLRASDFIKKKKIISLNAGGPSSSSSSSSEEDEVGESDDPEYEVIHRNSSSSDDSESERRGEDKIGHINHMYTINMMEREERGEEGHESPPPTNQPSTSSLFANTMVPPNAVLRAGGEGVSRQHAGSDDTGTERSGETSPTNVTPLPTSNLSKSHIPLLTENNFVDSLDMAGDPTPLGVIYTLEDGWGLRRVERGYRKILIKNTTPLHIREVTGALLNLHAKPIKPDNSHVPNGKQCEATAKSGHRCTWKLGAARLGAEGGECAARLGQGFDFCSWHIADEVKRETILAGYRTKLRSGFMPPSNSYMLLPMALLATQWKRIPDVIPVSCVSPPPHPLQRTPDRQQTSRGREGEGSNTSTTSSSALSRSPTTLPIRIERGAQGGEYDEQGDIAWIWDHEKKTRVITGGNGEVPSPEEIKRFLTALAQGAEGLTVKDSLITRANGEVDDFYNDIFAAVHECVVALALKYDNQFARGMVASFPFLTDYARDCQESERRWRGVTNTPTPSQSASQSQPVPPVPEGFRPPRVLDSPLPDTPTKVNQGDCSIMMIEGEDGEEEQPQDGNIMWVDDSGASESQSPHQGSFVRMKLEPQKFRIAKGSLRTEYKGKVRMLMSGAFGEEVSVYDSHTTYNPHLRYGLVATSAWVKQKLAVVHQNNQVIVLKEPVFIKEEQVVARGRSLQNNLSVFDAPGMPPLNPNEWYEPVPLNKKRVKVRATGGDATQSTVTF